MMSARPPYAPTGKPPPTILPSTVRSGFCLQQLLGAAVGQPEAGHHFVVDQQGAVLFASGGAVRSGTPATARPAHVADDRFEDDAGDLVAVRLERSAQACDVVVAQHQRVGGAAVRARRDCWARRASWRWSRPRRAGYRRGRDSSRRT